MKQQQLRDIKIPADASDQQTTDARSALPPVEFSVTRSNGINVVSITDRLGVQNRASAASYRVYFLPSEFAPTSSGTTTTVSPSVVYHTAQRAAGRKVASLVTDISAPALGTILQYNDTLYAGQAGFYFCAAVSRAGVEAPPEHMVPTDAIVGQPTTLAAASSGGSVAPSSSVSFDTTLAGSITGTIDGVNTAFVMTHPFGSIDLVWVDGILDLAATAIGTALTVGVAPITDVAVEHVA